MGAKSWATYKLHHGDLTALAAIGADRPHDDDRRVERLRQRKFVAARKNGSVGITMRGRLSLLIKRLTL